jgi:malate dehydrogenase (oxaloacetate-decarboxylating)(NADP+)
MHPHIPGGAALLRDPSLNKGTAFTAAERDRLGLRGLLPHTVLTQAQQVEKVLGNFRRKPTALEKYIDLAALHDRNETLFFRLLTDHLEEMMPIIYTPTVGLACQEYAHIFQRSRGVFITATDRGHVAEALAHWPERDVRMIVVTDGERILGLGDLGANGMAIPIGKLALYTAAAGIPPTQCLPVVLDVGTNNPELLSDPLYIGIHERRLTGKPYDDLVDEFIEAAQSVFPGVIVQFEDFANHNAFKLLHKYRDRMRTFNDDIQGTAAVAVAALLSSLHVTGTALSDQRLLFAGAGEAATGIAELAVAAMVAEGLPLDKARRRCWLMDSKGLVVAGRSGLADHKLPYAHTHHDVPDLKTAVTTLRPTALIGVAATGGLFTAEIVQSMAQINERPIIFALSNPTSKSECTAVEAYEWSEGRALFASGSPFGMVSAAGRKFVPRQGNNAYIFPGVGLGVLASGATRITDGMFLAAARALAACVSEEDLEQGSLLPPLTTVRSLSARIASAVADEAYVQGLAPGPRPVDTLAFVTTQMWTPDYPAYDQT